MDNTAFLRGIGAGAAAGAMIGAVVTAKRGAMKTGAGRALQKASNAMDSALYDIKHAVR